MDLKDKIYGTLYGIAIGDALGLGAEFMTRSEMRLHYPQGLNHYSQIIRDAHRCQWEQGDWTNDTELIMILLESTIEKGKIDISDYAQRLKKWFDNDPVDIPSSLRWMLNDPEWTDKPAATAEKVWKDMGIFESSNEANIRGLIPAIFSDNPMRDTKRLTAITHPDSLCIVSGMLITRMAHSLMWKDEPATFEELKQVCYNTDRRAIPYLEAAYMDEPEKLDIDNPDTIWHTSKSMAIALWSAWHCSSPEETLHRVVEFAGDADTNAAAALGLSGMRYGYKALPADLARDLLQHERIEDIARRFADLVIASQNNANDE